MSLWNSKRPDINGRTLDCSGPGTVDILHAPERLVEMTNEDMERHMEFMLQQEAKHEARIQQIEEIIVSLAHGTQDRLEVHDKLFDELHVKIAALVDSQIHTEEM